MRCEPFPFPQAVFDAAEKHYAKVGLDDCVRAYASIARAACKRGCIEVWRAVRVPLSPEKQSQVRLDRLGVYWSFDPDAASDYDYVGDGDDTETEVVVIHARVAAEDVNWASGLHNYVGIPDECEVQVMPDSPVQVLDVGGEPCARPVWGNSGPSEVARGWRPNPSSKSRRRDAMTRFRSNPDPYRDQAFRETAIEAYEDLLGFLSKGKAKDNRYDAWKEVVPASRSRSLVAQYGALAVHDRADRTWYIFFPLGGGEGPKSERQGSMLKAAFGPSDDSDEGIIQFFGLQAASKRFKIDFAAASLPKALGAAEEFLRGYDEEARFVHEYAHRLDYRRVGDAWKHSVDKSTASIRGYVRDPLEFNARYHATMSRIDELARQQPEFFGKMIWTFDSFLNYLRGMEGNEEIALHFDRHNSPLYRHAIKRLHEDWQRLRSEYGDYLKKPRAARKKP